MKKLRNGQVALYLLTVIVAIFLLVLLNIDTFLAVRTRNRLQNGGDSAAIAAARKQGSALNEIGRLNFDHIAAAIANNATLCDETVLLQRKIALLQPVEALDLANKAAKKNGLPVRDEFAWILREHVKDVRLVYAGGGENGDPYPESYPGAWTEYATAIESVISTGLAIGPDNLEFYDPNVGHMLLNRDFYYAIGGTDWCWFFFNCYGLLQDYGSYHDWAPLPPRKDSSKDNSEIFSLHVHAVSCALTDVFTNGEIIELMNRYAHVVVTEDDLKNSELISDEKQTWFFFESAEWGSWFEGLHLSGDDETGDFPLVGEVKSEYNVRGCASVCRAVRPAESFSNDTTVDLTWTAAAKPFGALDLPDGVKPITAHTFFVVPGFTDVRLVAVDAVPGGDLGSADFAWVDHVRNHLPLYMAHGPLDNACYYCNQLKTWENKSFHERGVLWLRFNSSTCVRPSGGGRAHGGTSHGH